MTIDPKFFNQVSQWAHWGVACTLYLTFAIVLHHFGRLHVEDMIIVDVFGVTLAAWKEFFYDEHYENDETRGSSLEDFSFYLLGISTANLITFLFLDR